jgi:hypothetical protein
MPARFCQQCGNEVSSTARFCPNCAAPLNGASPPPGPAGLTAHPLDTATRRSRSLLLPAAIVAVVVLAIALAVLAAKSRQQASLLVSPTPVAVAAPAVTNAPVLPPTVAPPLTNAPTAPPMTGPGVTNAPDKPTPTLPPDVAAYLSFLQGIEEKRIAQNNDLTSGMALMPIVNGLSGTQGADTEGDPSDPSDGQNSQKAGFNQTNHGLGNIDLKFQMLVREFRSKPPPPSCTLLANKYLLFLGDYSTLISKMQVMIMKHVDDPNDQSGPSEAAALSQAVPQINTDGTQADSALTDLCAHYGVPKPFVIAPEGAAPSLLGH